MKIAVLAHIRHPIAEPFMGGMEAHCHRLVTALRGRGHRVTLYAAHGSDLPGTRAICAAPYEAVLPWAQWHGKPELAAYQGAAFDHAWEALVAGSYDVVHNNSLFAPIIRRAAAARMPMVTSQHVPPFGPMRDAVNGAGLVPSQQFTVTSAQQRSLWPDAGDNLHVVPNGVDIADWPISPKRTGRLIWFGRITPNKGLQEAVAAAVRARVALDIVGSMEDPAYYQEHVAPYLGDKIRYLGHLSGRTLRETVSTALAAVVTPMWDEPFGLVAAEAMAAAVPVIAFDRGAMREVLGECGRLVPASDVAALAEAMTYAHLLDGGRCRARIAARFSVERMLDGYERCYAAAIAGVDAGPVGVRA